MDYELIAVAEKSDGQVTEIVLGPPPGNIVSAKMIAEISAQLQADEKDPHKKLIVFSGQGKHFSFGASVEEHQPEQVGAMLPAFHGLIGQIIGGGIPTLAKVSGLCLGGGCELALACTFIFADEKAKFGVPEIQLGVFPPPACVLLPCRGSDPFAAQMILTGGQFPAEVLQQRGLVNEVVASGKLDEVVDAFFEKQLRPRSASSLRIACRASRMVLAEQYRNFIGRLEDLYLKELMATQDAAEGIRSFLEKKSPQWRDA